MQTERAETLLNVACLPVGDPRQVSMGTEWLTEPQESGVYKRGSRGVETLHTL